jgi:hypothetical protein
LDARTTLSPQHAFVLSDKDIKKLCALLADRIGPVTIDTKTIADLERQFTYASKLCEVENPWEKRIVDLRITARSEDWKKRATVRFSESRFAPIDVEVSASEIVVERLRQDLIDILRGLRPWYSRIARIDFILGIMFGLSFVSLLAAGLVAFGVVRLKEQNANDIYNREIRGFWLVIVGGTFGWAANQLRKLLFPIGIITVGQVAKRHSLLETIRWTVGIGFLVSFAASIAVLFV